MAPPCSFLFLLQLAFLLMISSPQISALSLPTAETIFVQEPEANYYIKREPVKIVCKAKNADDIKFECNGEPIPQTSEENVEADSPDISETRLTIYKDDILKHQKEKKGEPFWCRCAALDVKNQVIATTRKAVVSVAYLNSKFEAQPSNTVAFEGDTVEMVCGAPKGSPKPEVIWRKNLKRLTPSHHPHLRISESGSLIINNLTTADAANYQCVVVNVAGRHESKTATLSVLDTLGSRSIMELNQAEEDLQGENVKVRHPRQSNKLMFNIEPKENYYVTPDQHAQLDCGIVGADLITFSCANERLKGNIERGLNPAGQKVIQSHLNVTYQYVLSKKSESSPLEEPIRCFCVGWITVTTKKPNSNMSETQWSYVNSNEKKGFIHIATLDKEFKVQPSDKVVDVNSQVILECEPPSGSPRPWVSWYKDGNKLEIRNSNKYSINVKGHLQLKNVQSNDAGSYYCVAENTYYSAQSRTARLRVKAEAHSTKKPTADSTEEDQSILPSVIPDAPEFLLYPEPEYELEANKAVSLTCAAILVERISVICERFRFNVSDLDVYNVTLDKTRKYKTVTASFIVAAQNLTKLGSECKCIGLFFTKDKKWSRFEGNAVTFKLKSQFVEPFLEKNFQLEPMSQKVFLDDEVELTCSPPQGHPKPEITWYKGNKPIDTTQDSNFIIRDNGTLIIEMIREEDEGRYLCVATNEAGSRRSRPAAITVRDKVPPTTTETTTTTTTPVTTEEPEPLETEFVEDLQAEYNVTDDTPAILKCDAVNVVLIIFICNNKTVDESHRNQQSIIFEGLDLKTNTLEVSKQQLASNAEGDTYTCFCRAFIKPAGSQQYVDGEIATIKYLDTEKEINANRITSEVQATPVSVSPKLERYISKELHSEYYIVKNKSVSLSCEAHNVKSITFMCDDKEVTDKETHQAVETNVDGVLVIENIVNSTIEVSKPENDDDIVCHCIAYYVDEETEETKSLTSRYGVVIVASLKKQFTQDPMDTTVSVGEMLSLSCVPPLGNPSPKVYWTKDGEKLETVTVVPNTFIIAEARVEDEGEYQCVAENSVGRRTSKVAKVVVKTMAVTDESSTTITIPVTDDKMGEPDCTEDFNTCFEDESCSKLMATVECINIYTEKCQPAQELRAELDSKLSEHKSKCAITCQGIDNCRGISTNQPINTQNAGVVDLKEVCENSADYINCVDRELDQCNLANDTQVSIPNMILSEFCNKMDFSDSSVRNCSSLRECQTDVVSVTRKGEQWCSLAFSVSKCFESSVRECQITGGAMKLEEWTFKKMCEEAPLMPSVPTSETEGPEPTPEPTNTPAETEDDASADPSQGKRTKDDGDDEDDNNKDDDDRNGMAATTLESDLPEIVTARHLKNDEEERTESPPSPEKDDSDESEEKDDEDSNSEDGKKSVKKDMSQIDEDDKMDGVEGDELNKAGSSKQEGGENKVSAQEASLMLAVLLQLVVTVCVSWR